jgi:hypothetical protein
LEDFIEDINNNTSPILFRSNTKDYLPNFLHNKFVFGGLCPDVAKGEIPVFKVVSLNAKDEVLILFDCISEALRHRLSIYAGILLEIGV